MVLSANNVSKIIQKKTILSHVTLQLHSGKVYGFVGPNGSGKTMLFRALSGLMSVSEGSVSLNGQVLHKDISILPSLGIVLEQAGLYPNLTGIKNLEYLAKFTKKASREGIREALIRVGLDPEDKRTYRKYSLGMKQKLAIAQAIMEHPDILMLDEPTNSLDEEGVGQIRQIILQEKNRGALVLLASHNSDDIRILTDELFRLCDGTVQQVQTGSSK